MLTMTRHWPRSRERVPSMPLREPSSMRTRWPIFMYGHGPQGSPEASMRRTDSISASSIGAGFRPKETMEKVYKFLEEPYFKHDYDHVDQVTWEDDEQHGIPELHIIRPKIEPVAPQWPKTLGDAANRFVPLNELWSKFDEKIQLAPLPAKLPPLPKPKSPPPPRGEASPERAGAPRPAVAGRDATSTQPAAKSAAKPPLRRVK